MTKRIKTLTVKRMTSLVQKRLEAFGFEIVWIRIKTGHAVIGYK